MSTVTEELFVLTIYERKNSILPSPVQAVPYMIIGAMLVDLISAGKLHLVEDKKIMLAEASPTGQRYLDAILETIQISGKSKKLTYWMTTFANRYKRLQRMLLQNLVQNGLVVESEEQLCWVLCPDEAGRVSSTKFQRKERLRAMVMANQNADEQSIYLLALLQNFGLLEFLFTADEIKAAGRGVKDLLKANPNTAYILRQIDEISTAAAIASAMRDPV